MTDSETFNRFTFGFELLEIGSEFELSSVNETTKKLRAKTCQKRGREDVINHFGEGTSQGPHSDAQPSQALLSRLQTKRSYSDTNPFGGTLFWPTKTVSK